LKSSPKNKTLARGTEAQSQEHQVAISSQHKHAVFFGTGRRHMILIYLSSDFHLVCVQLFNILDKKLNQYFSVIGCTRKRPTACTECCGGEWMERWEEVKLGGFGCPHGPRGR